MLDAPFSSVVKIALTLAFFGALMGCGLALDYDPPSDGGVDAMGLDAPAGCTPACGPGTLCVSGQCLHTCDVDTPCHFDDAACETCDLGRGVCIASDATCDGGCSESCNPVSDACEPNCPAGQSCLGGTCTPRVPCSDDIVCSMITNRCGVPASCGMDGFCEDAPIMTCPSFECADADACNDCALTPRPSACTGTTPFCDPTDDRYRCVACFTSSDCDASSPVCDPASGQCGPCMTDEQCAGAAGGPHCAVPTGLCVGCASDDHCVDPAQPVCDLASNTCVECRTSAECGDRAVCRSDHTCGPCSDSAECGGRAICMDGDCVAPSCSAGAICPAVPCATARCDAGRCAYTPTAASGVVCNDVRSCTTDSCAPLDPRADPSGCVHVANAGGCDDRIDCTVDVCVGSRLLGATGCSHRPNPAACGDGSTDCVRWLCLPEGRVVGLSGCRQQFVPDRCAPGHVCSSDGNCVGMTGCDGCTPDGFACNGNETCVGGMCEQLFDAASSCTGACNSICVDDSTCINAPGLPLVCS